MACLQTGWGTRAGIGDPSAAMAAVDDKPSESMHDIKGPSSPPQQRYHDMPAPAPQYAQQMEMQTGFAR